MSNGSEASRRSDQQEDRDQMDLEFWTEFH